MQGISPRYTVLVVTWNGDDLLKTCLDSLVQALDEPPPCVVVDNGAAESTRALCAGYPFVDYVRAPDNLGFAGGNNLGLPFCKTEYVCLLNNDTRLRGDSFGPLVRFLDAHPHVAVAQGTLILPRCGGAYDDCGTRLTRWGLQNHRFFRTLPRGPLEAAAVFSAKGAFMMVRKGVLDALGGVLFYDDFKSYYEETDFCHRVWLSGSEVWFVPTQPVEHLCGATSGRMDNAAIWRQYLGNIFFSFLANFSYEGFLRILLPFTVVYAGYLGKCLATGRIRHFCAAACVVRDLWGRRANLKAARRRVQGMRVLSDHAFLARVLGA